MLRLERETGARMSHVPYRGSAPMQAELLGGSLPLAIITERLGTEVIILPIANPDNNQHAENENLRLQNLWDGIEALVAVMRMQ